MTQEISAAAAAAHMAAAFGRHPEARPAAEVPGPPAAGHARCPDADHHHCPRCGGRLAAFAHCAPCGVSVDFRIMPAPSPDMAALLAIRDDLHRTAGSGQQLTFIELCVRLDIPVGHRTAAAAWALDDGTPVEVFRRLTRDQAYRVLAGLERLDRWLDENPPPAQGDQRNGE